MKKPPPPPPPRARARAGQPVKAAQRTRSRTMTTTVTDVTVKPPARAPEPAPPEREPRRIARSAGKPTKPRPRTAMALPSPRVDDHTATVHEEAVFVQARRWCATGQFREAHAALELALTQEPDSVTGRKLMLKACIGLRLGDAAASHGEWLIARFVRAEQDLMVCDVYARLVKASIPAPWKETTLTTVALAAQRADKGNVLLDATKRLLKLFPGSRALPSILLAAAERQAAKGRIDLARKTLRHIIARYPNHVEAVRAEQRLADTPDTQVVG